MIVCKPPIDFVLEKAVRFRQFGQLKISSLDII